MKNIFVLSFICLLIGLSVQAERKSVEPVYKIMRAGEWSFFSNEGRFDGSEADLKDGFIHLSKKDQLKRVIDKYFSDSRPIYVAKFSKPSFLQQLVWEEASSGGLYPHLYDSALHFVDVDSYQVLESFDSDIE